jgi:hypothetical protein
MTKLTFLTVVITLGAAALVSGAVRLCSHTTWAGIGALGAAVVIAWML